MKTWIEHVQYRAECDGCGEKHMVAIVDRRQKPRLRLCRKCYVLGAWAKPSFNDARFQRVRAHRLQVALSATLKERDAARADLEAAVDRQVSMLGQQPGYHGDPSWALSQSGVTYDGNWRETA